jgi:hypothetical protein
LESLSNPLGIFYYYIPALNKLSKKTTEEIIKWSLQEMPWAINVLNGSSIMNGLNYSSPLGTPLRETHSRKDERTSNSFHFINLLDRLVLGLLTLIPEGSIQRIYRKRYKINISLKIPLDRFSFRE